MSKNKNLGIELKLTREKTLNKLPRYATEGSSGFDLFNALEKEIYLKPGECIIVPSGISIRIYDPNITGIIVPRSGLGSQKGIVLGNTVGVIDSDYSGEIMLPLLNRSKTQVLIEPLIRVAQIIFFPILKIDFLLVKEFSSSDTKRGENGFGHSGM